MYIEQQSTQILAAPHLEETSVLKRICVQPPYFALFDTDFNGRFRAKARADSPPTREVGPMRASELSRHAAIAGLCCVALSQRDEEHRYYLATEVHYRAELSHAPYGSEVALEASLLEFGKRQGRASITVTCGGPLATLEVTYSVLKTRMFEKLFAAFQLPTPRRSTIPPLPRNALNRGGDYIEHALTRLPAECCVGHFDNYPALPVALLVGEISFLAEELLESRTFVREAHVQADRLCWAERAVTFRVEHCGQRGRLHRLHGRADTHDGPAAHTDFTVEAC